ncbi:hypothetical protein MD484_g5593, partial [Candolleomyces efflorescens]
MASSDQDTAPIQPSKETLQTESKATDTAADANANDNNVVVEPVVDAPKPAIVQPDGDDNDEGPEPVYSDEEDQLPVFEGGKFRGKINQPVSGGSGGVSRPPRPVKK